MFLENKGNVILSIIHKYRKEYVNNERLPELLICDNDDGTHIPLIPRSDNGEDVYLYCLTCDFSKRTGLVTADRLASLMRWRDLNPSGTLTL